MAYQQWRAPSPPYGGSAGNAAQGEALWSQWKCTQCSTENWTNYGSQKRNCRQCGMKKNYADGGGNGQADMSWWAANPPPPPPYPVRRDW
eukprot:672039-Heterocapsa_arctica.AAC.1